MVTAQISPMNAASIDSQSQSNYTNTLTSDKAQPFQVVAD